MDSVKHENERLLARQKRENEEKQALEGKLERVEQECESLRVNNELLKETCTVLEEQLTDYERLTTDHEFRENTLVQEKMKIQKEMESLEEKLRQVRDFGLAFLRNY